MIDPVVRSQVKEFRPDLHLKLARITWAKFFLLCLPVLMLTFILVMGTMAVKKVLPAGEVGVVLAEFGALGWLVSLLVQNFILRWSRTVDQMVEDAADAIAHKMHGAARMEQEAPKYIMPIQEVYGVVGEYAAAHHERQSKQK